MNKNKWPEAVKIALRYATLLMLTLRACDVIDWPWYIVLLPVIVPLAILAVCIILAGIAAVSVETKK